MPSGQTVGAVVGAVGFAAAGVATYSLADTTTGEAETVVYDATPLPTTTTTTPPTTLPPTTVPGDTVPDGPVIDPESFGTDRPTGLVGGILFDELTAVGVAPNVANCAIESVPGGVENIDTAAVLAGDTAAAQPVVDAALSCGIDQGTIDAVFASITGG
jgi:hypothetical protein